MLDLEDNVNLTVHCQSAKQKPKNVNQTFTFHNFTVSQNMAFVPKKMNRQSG